MSLNLKIVAIVFLAATALGCCHRELDAVTDLRSGNSNTRKRALETVLSEQHPTDATLRAVVESFRFEKSYGLPLPVAFNTAQVIILRKATPRSIPILIEGLHDSSVHVRRNCAYTLGLIKTNVAFEPLWQATSAELSHIQLNQTADSPEVAAFRADVLAMLQIDRRRSIATFAREAAHTDDAKRRHCMLNALDQVITPPVQCDDESSDGCQKALAKISETYGAR